MDTTLIGVLTHLGAGAGTIVVLIILRILVPGWVYADEKRKTALCNEELTAQRERADQAVEALEASKNVMAALQFGLQMGLRGGEGQQPPPAPPALPGGPAP